MTVTRRWLAMLAFLLWTAQCSAAEEVRITGNEARAPKIFNDQNGAAQGILIEIMRYVQEQTGIQFNYSLYPWARAYKSALSGEAGIIGLSLTTERQAIFDYTSEPLFYDELVLVVKAGREFPFSTVNDLKGKTVGVCRGCSYGDVYEKAVKDRIFEPVQGDSPNAQLAMLLLDRIDAVLIPVGRAGLEESLRGKQSGFDLLKQRDKFVILPQPFARDPNYLAFAKTMEKRKLLMQVDRALKKGHESGAIKRLVDRYIAERNTREHAVEGRSSGN
ncbi:MAG TPA: transporter substrate-binding domain-containing protein [Noviherbaspirillum sp.]|nr:transporter substrate-binding domain-containing protein [Noviherbaspirillum sp.]